MTRQLTEQQIEEWRQRIQYSWRNGDPAAQPEIEALCDMALDSLRSQPAGGRWVPLTVLNDVLALECPLECREQGTHCIVGDLRAAMKESAK